MIRGRCVYCMGYRPYVDKRYQASEISGHLSVAWTTYDSGSDGTEKGLFPIKP
jgi:hypothetical protein